MPLPSSRSLPTCAALFVASVLLVDCRHLGTARADGPTVHVDSAAAAGGDGSPQRPFATLKAALAAAPAGATLKVGAGTYKEGTLEIRKAVTLLGGFVGKGNFDARDATKNISSLVGTNTAKEHKGGAVVLITDRTDGATIDGFTITGGRHGIYIENTGSTKVFTVSHNIIERNGVDKPDHEEKGGGLKNEEMNLDLIGNTIRHNISGRGAGVAATGGEGHVRIQDNLFEANIGKGDHGGGVYLSQPGEVIHNTFRGNESNGSVVTYNGGVGSGICVLGPMKKDEPVHLSQNVYTDNYAAKRGTVFIDDYATATMDHELIYKNRPSAEKGTGGAGIYVDGGDKKKPTNLQMRFTTVADNGVKGPGKGNGLYLTKEVDVTIESSIFWNNGDGDDIHIEAPDQTALQISYSIYRTAMKGFKVGPGNLAANPLFFDPAHGDYHLKSKNGRWHPTAAGFEWVKDTVDSPAIDAADPKAPFDKELPLNGSRGNLGAFGNTAQASKSKSGSAAGPTSPPTATAEAPPGAPGAAGSSSAAALPPSGRAPGPVPKKRFGCASSPTNGRADLVPIGLLSVAVVAGARRRRARGRCEPSS